jgi:threonine-phosphate decarboxylase
MQSEELLLGNGSTQLIYLVCATLRPRKALVVGPAFSEYANALRLAGTNIRFLLPPASGDFTFPIGKFMAAWKKDYDIVFLSTPNSVTGQLIPRTELEKIAHLAFLRKTFLVIDEAFIDFVERESVKRLVRENPYLIVLRSLTKYYSLPGLRLGYLLAQAQKVKQFIAHQEPWSVSGPAQAVALVCLADAHFSSQTDRWLRRERSFLSHGLAALKGFRVYLSSANFLLVKIENRSGDAMDLRSFLLGKKILIRACDSFLGLGAHYFRVAVRRRKENQQLLEALKGWSA